MSDYDYSGVQSLFDWSGDNATGGMEAAALGNGIDTAGSFGDLDKLSDADWAVIGKAVEANPDMLNEPSTWDKIVGGASSLGSSASKLWSGMGNTGQQIAGGLVLGGLQSYMQQRQRDEELQKMGQMSEEQWQRQMLLKQAPTAKVADVNHFKGIVQSLRGGH